MFVGFMDDTVFPGEAVLLYDTLTDGTLDFHHTEVPPALRGHGIAGQLAEVAFRLIISSQKYNNYDVCNSSTYLCSIAGGSGTC